MSLMKITSNIRNYVVRFAEDAGFLEEFGKIAQRCYVVDHKVWDLYRGGCLKRLEGEEVVVLPIDEEKKSLDSVQGLYDRLTARSAKRNMTLVSIGGGILQDITGFASSTLYRGINWLFVPTTLLAQADSCIGSKTSLNYKGFKNLIGTFYPPSEIFIYTPFLSTQADVDYFSGLGEVIKLHLMGGPDKTRQIMDLLPRLGRREPEALQIAVRNSLSIKQEYICEDEFDGGRRNMLNFGHCFGHAIEATSNFEIPHGQAIVLGMLLANTVACSRKLLAPEFQEYVAQKLLLPSLIVSPKREALDPGGVVNAMKKDKKRTGEGLALIMMKEGHEMLRVNDLTEPEVARALQSIKSFRAGGFQV
jgi:3-dehydroquinate synthase